MPLGGEAKASKQSSWTLSPSPDFGGRTGLPTERWFGSFFSEDLLVRRASNAGVCFPAELLHSENLSPWEIRSHKLQVTFVSLEVTSARLLRPGYPTEFNFIDADDSN